MITAKVLAHNERGWSAESDPNASGVSIQTEPSKMPTPASGSSTAYNQLHVTWTLLTSPTNGDSSILSYILYWDQGSSSWTEVVGESSVYTNNFYVISSGVTAGTTYQFKVAARNAWGVGAFSDPVSIIA